MELIRREKKRVRDLEVEAENWRRAEKIRAYIEAVKKAGGLKDRHMDDNSLAQWIKWAQEQADRIDPLTASPPSILDEEENFSPLWPE
jgi:hypothetical protein